MLLLLKGSYLLVIILMIVSVVLVSLYDNLLQKDLSPDFYLGTAFLVGIVSAVCVYINTIPQPVLTEEILNGPPNF
jgi:predicted neutral ceramidase superfamily lipid hydrolase